MQDAAGHPAFRRRAGDGPVFTSTKCPPAPGLKHSCELPFGFVWTPMSPSSTVAVVSTSEERGEALPPVLCLMCLAYINLYATFNESTGTWICPLCGQENVAPEGIFHAESDQHSPLSLALVAPVVEYRQRVNDASSFDGAMDSRSYVLVLDGNLPCDEVKSVVTAMQTLLLEEAHGGIRVQLGLVIYDQMVSVYQLGLIGMASADMYPPLQNDAEEVDDEVLIQRRKRMENRSYFVHVRSEEDLAILWLCVSAVYGLQVQQVNGNGTKNDPSRDGGRPLSRKEKLRIQKEARLRKELSGSLELDAVAKTSPVESPWSSNEHSLALRCTWDATHCAVDLAIFGSYHVPRSSRVLLFTNGCPNIGIGSVVNRTFTEETSQQHGLLRPSPHSVDAVQMIRAVEYFELTGKYATESGVGVDVFCSGAEFLAMPTYQALVRPSGGYALSHESFSSPRLAHNLGYIVSQTHMSIADCDGVVEHASSSTMDQLQGCLVDLRISSFVTPTHVVGAGEILEDDQGLLVTERSAFAVGASLAASRGFATNNIPSNELLASTLTRVRLGRYDPLSSMSVMLQVNDEILPDDRYAVFQCTVRFIDPASQELVTRVSTSRLPVALSVNDFLESMDEEAVPVVLGKEAVYRSVVGRQEDETAAADVARIEFLAYEAQRDLDATVHRISGAFRLLGLEEGNLSDRILTEEGGIVASPFSSLDFAFPPELADALHRLFHLRRGALLSPGPLQSADDRAEMRSLFLRLPLDDCLCIMAPSLWSAEMQVRNGDMSLNLEPIPSDTLTLWDNRIIAADHHDTLFVWSGRGVGGSEFDAVRDHCEEFLLERSRNRFPMPHLYSLAEGDSMSRRFTARLAPSHADPLEQQMVHFPALADLSPSELSALREKFRFYDASADASFRRWFWGVASASSSAGDEGVSLCL